jgi:hypothetical protein
MNRLVSAMHDFTHLVPGIPAHDETRAARRPGRNTHSPRMRNRAPHQNKPSQHHHAPPRVLVGWQNWIARGLRRRQRADQS